VVVCWHKQAGDTIKRDEALVDIETDKVVLEVPAPVDGVLEKIMFTDGDTVTSDQVLGVINANGAVRVAETSPVTENQTTDNTAGTPPGPGQLAACWLKTRWMST